MKPSTKHRIDSVLNQFTDSLNTEREIVSAFINIDQRDPQNSKQLPRWSQELNNAFFDISSNQNTEFPESMKTWTEVEAHILGLINADHYKTPSIAVFTCGVGDLVVPLPANVDTVVDVGLPQLGKLLKYTEGYNKYCVVLFSETGHRVIVINHSLANGSTLIERKMSSDLPAKKLDNDSLIEASERRIAAVDISDHFFATPDYRQMIFGGNIQVAQDVRYSLHNSIAEHLVTIEALEFDMGDEDLCRSVRQIAINQQKLKDTSLLNELTVIGNNVSVFGLDNTTSALVEGKVKKVILPYPFDTKKFNPLIIEAITQGTEIEVIYAEAAQRLVQLGGVAGVLYERI